MRCMTCSTDLGTQETITSVEGILMCNECAAMIETEAKEEVVPSDIGITPECEWCNEEFEESELTDTKIGRLCRQCIAAIRSRGEEI